jgi:hypothetical protein
MDQLHKSLRTLLRDFPDLPPVKDRYPSNSWVYDGKSFALRKCKGRNYSAFEILHEICHWLIADEDQREFPEFGLYLAVVDFMAWGTPEDGFRDKHGRLNWEATQDASDGYFDADEQLAQEIATQRLTVLLGTKYNVPIRCPDLPEIKSWEDYKAFKDKENLKASKEVLSRVETLLNQAIQ